MKVLFLGGPWDGRVVDMASTPYHFYIAQYTNDEGQVVAEAWSDRIYFGHDKVLRVCYVENRAWEDIVIYIVQGLTVRHATAAMMAAYNWAVEQGWNPNVSPGGHSAPTSPAALPPMHSPQKGLPGGQ